MLTGKAKSDFEKWYWNDWLTGSDRDYYEKDEVIENSWKAEKLFLFSLIIEWFDSVGAYIYLRRDDVAQRGFNWSIESKRYGFHNLHNHAFYFDRNQATEQAIIKANEIYNSQ